MKLLICFGCFLGAFSLKGYSQNDEFPDYRSKREFFTRIVEKDIRAEVASFAFGGLDESIGKLPLTSIPITSAGKDFITFGGNNIEVRVHASPFVPAKHKLGYIDNKYLVKIDNKAFFGDYGKVPKTCFDSAFVIIDVDTIQIPTVALTDLCNPVFASTENGIKKSSNKVFVSNDGRRVYVYFLKQEMGGSYESTWVIQDKKYLRRIVDFGFLK